MIYEWGLCKSYFVVTAHPHLNKLTQIHLYNFYVKLFQQNNIFLNIAILWMQ